jgi:hypothetical protein
MTKENKFNKLCDKILSYTGVTATFAFIIPQLSGITPNKFIKTKNILNKVKNPIIGSCLILWNIYGAYAANKQLQFLKNKKEYNKSDKYSLFFAYSAIASSLMPMGKITKNIITNQIIDKIPRAQALYSLTAGNMSSLVSDHYNNPRIFSENCDDYSRFGNCVGLTTSALSRFPKSVITQEMLMIASYLGWASRSTSLSINQPQKHKIAATSEALTLFFISCSYLNKNCPDKKAKLLSAACIFSLIALGYGNLEYKWREKVTNNDKKHSKNQEL